MWAHLEASMEGACDFQKHFCPSSLRRWKLPLACTQIVQHLLTLDKVSAGILVSALQWQRMPTQPPRPLLPNHALSTPSHLKLTRLLASISRHHVVATGPHPSMDLLRFGRRNKLPIISSTAQTISTQATQCADQLNRAWLKGDTAAVLSPLSSMPLLTDSQPRRPSCLCASWQVTPWRLARLADRLIDLYQR